MTKKTANANSPRHLFDTGKFATLPPHLQPYRPTLPGTNAKTAKASPHLVADRAKAHKWPTQDAAPTRALQVPKPRPHVPSPTVEPPMTAKDALTMQKACLWAACLVAAFGLVALIAVNWAGGS